MPLNEAETPPGEGGAPSSPQGDIGTRNNTRPDRPLTPDEIERALAHPDELWLIRVRDELIRPYLDPECLDITPADDRRGTWVRLDWNASAPGAPGSSYDRKGRPRFAKVER